MILLVPFLFSPKYTVFKSKIFLNTFFLFCIFAAVLFWCKSVILSSYKVVFILCSPSGSFYFFYFLCLLSVCTSCTLCEPCSFSHDPSHNLVRARTPLSIPEHGSPAPDHSKYETVTAWFSWERVEKNNDVTWFTVTHIHARLAFDLGFTGEVTAVSERRRSSGWKRRNVFWRRRSRRFASSWEWSGEGYSGAPPTEKEAPPPSCCSLELRSTTAQSKKYLHKWRFKKK